MGVVGISGALMPSSAQTRHSATTAHSLSALPPHERTGTTPHMRMPHHMDMDMGPHEQITAHPPPRSPHTRTTQSHRIIESQRDPPPPVRAVSAREREADGTGSERHGGFQIQGEVTTSPARDVAASLDHTRASQGQEVPPREEGGSQIWGRSPPTTVTVAPFPWAALTNASLAARMLGCQSMSSRSC